MIERRLRLYPEALHASISLLACWLLCNIAQVAEDRMSQSDLGARCIPQGEVLGELRQSESWLAPPDRY